MYQHWTLLSIPLPKATPGQNVRKILARENDKAPQELQIPEAIFQYKHKRAVKGISLFRFWSKERIFRIAAIGDPASSFLLEHADRVTYLLSRHYRAALSYTSNVHPFLVGWSAPQSYMAFNMIFQKDKETWQEIRNDVLAQAKTDRIVELVEQKIRRDLQAQARYLGFGEADDIMVDRVALHGPFYSADVHSGVHGVMVPRVTFRANITLHGGPWNVGYAKSKGYGWVCCPARRPRFHKTTRRR